MPRNGNYAKRRIVLLMITLITAGGTYAVCNHQLENQQYIAIDESRAIPMIHFMNIGLTNDGGYSPEDAQAMAELPTKTSKNRLFGKKKSKSG